STMNEITPAILSITMVMAAVFLPIGFMEGPSGVFYRQFSYTLAAAIIISAINALTLSPALCALFLKPAKKEGNAALTDVNESTSGQCATIKDKAKGLLNRFFLAFNTSFDMLTAKYLRSIKFLIKKRKIALLGFAVISAIGFF